MEATCHRCNGSLVDAMPYCPHCGAPQLVMNTYAQPLAAAIEAGDLAAGHKSSGLNASINWHAAIQAALLVTAVRGVLLVIANLFPISGTISLLWWSAAAALTVGLYHRKSPKSLITATIGARIGSLVGLFLSAMYMLVGSASLLLDRYALRQGDSFTSKLAQNNLLIMNFYRSSGRFDADTLASMQQSLDYMLTTSGRVTTVLMGMVCVGAFTLAFCVVTGAIGGKLILRRQDPV
jgi:hypothetical protein